MVRHAVMVLRSDDASFLDVDVQAVPPRWPPLPRDLVVEDGVYELTEVPISSIALATSRILKVMQLADLV